MEHDSGRISFLARPACARKFIMLLAAVALAVTTLLAPPPHRPTAAGVVRPAAARHPPVRCGVPGFVSWICETAPSASYELPEDFKASVVCFDLNAILHNQLRKARNEQHAVLVFGTLHNVLDVKPTDTVVLALDGPAPAARYLRSSRRMKTSKKEGKFQDRRGMSSWSHTWHPLHGCSRMRSSLCLLRAHHQPLRASAFSSRARTCQARRSCSTPSIS